MGVWGVTVGEPVARVGAPATGKAGFAGGVMGGPDVAGSGPAVSVLVWWPVSSVVMALPCLLTQPVVILAASLTVGFGSREKSVSYSVTPVSASVVRVPGASTSVAVPASAPWSLSGLVFFGASLHTTG